MIDLNIQRSRLQGCTCHIAVEVRGLHGQRNPSSRTKNKLSQSGNMAVYINQVSMHPSDIPVYSTSRPN